MKMQHATTAPGTLKQGLRSLSVLVGVAIAALLVAFSIAALDSSQATATIYAVDQDAVAAVSGDSAADDAAAAGEQIEDEFPPMAASPYAGSDLTGMTWLVIAGIVAAIAYFAFTTNKLNNDIRRLHRFTE